MTAAFQFSHLSLAGLIQEHRKIVWTEPACMCALTSLVALHEQSLALVLLVGLLGLVVHVVHLLLL